MHKDTTIRRIGNSSGLTIPKEVLERHHLIDGDRVHIIETDAGLLITPYDLNFEEAMDIYEEGARRYRNAMRTLSK